MRSVLAIVLLSLVSAALLVRASEPPAKPKATGDDEAASKPETSAEGGLPRNRPGSGESSLEKRHPEPSGVGRSEPERKLFTGRVVLVRKALQRRGIQAFEELKGQVALETPDGRLSPIIPDWRGRAFFQDERLRNRKVDLVCYQHEGLPYLQVLMIYTFDKEGARQYTDYWCDVCSIPMYEIKPCDCCQGPIRLRFQPRDLPDYVQDAKK